MIGKRRKRVRMHLVDVGLPSVEGVLQASHRREYEIAVPSLMVAPGANAAELEAHYLLIPRERVAFYEVLS